LPSPCRASGSREFRAAYRRKRSGGPVLMTWAAWRCPSMRAATSRAARDQGCGPGNSPCWATGKAKAAYSSSTNASFSLTVPEGSTTRPFVGEDSLQCCWHGFRRLNSSAKRGCRRARRTRADVHVARSTVLQSEALCKYRSMIRPRTRPTDQSGSPITLDSMIVPDQVLIEADASAPIVELRVGRWSLLSRSRAVSSGCTRSRLDFRFTCKRREPVVVAFLLKSFLPTHRDLAGQ
jgi:hypothetical protein